MKHQNPPSRNYDAYAVTEGQGGVSRLCVQCQEDDGLTTMTIGRSYNGEPLPIQSSLEPNTMCERCGIRPFVTGSHDR